MKPIFFVFLSTLVLAVNCVIVQLRDGYINGTSEITKEGRLFHKFLGIPYAKPPVGSLRFQPPQPVDSWKGIKAVNQPPPMCVQKGMLSFGSSLGQEDCLYLNVYIPHALLKISGKAPVIVGIHGGAFQTGSSNDYPADDFMESDVIFVSMNYRLGILGFLVVNELPILTWDNNEISGNFGLKDQSLALRWVNENIARLGGDPNNVTLLGESAGAASVHFHMFSPLSKGLFQKAIMDNGNAFSPHYHFQTHNNYTNLSPTLGNLTLRLDQWTALAFISKTGCLNISKPQTIKQSKLKCLQDIPTEHFTKPGSLKDYLLYLPTIEFGVKEGNAFLPNEPNATNYQTKVPWLAGMRFGEGALISPVLSRNGSMIDDRSWLVPLRKTISSGPDVQYLYLYDQKEKNITAVDFGVSHDYEVAMLFRIKKLEANRSIEHRRVSDTLLQYWINFAISQDPNNHSKGKLWQPNQTRNESFKYLHIKSDGRVNMETLETI